MANRSLLSFETHKHLEITTLYNIFKKKLYLPADTPSVGPVRLAIQGFFDQVAHGPLRSILGEATEGMDE